MSGRRDTAALGGAQEALAKGARTRHEDCPADAPRRGRRRRGRDDDDSARAVNGACGSGPKLRRRKNGAQTVTRRGGLRRRGGCAARGVESANAAGDKRPPPAVRAPLPLPELDKSPARRSVARTAQPAGVLYAPKGERKVDERERWMVRGCRGKGAVMFRSKGRWSQIASRARRHDLRAEGMPA